MYFFLNLIHFFIIDNLLEIVANFSVEIFGSNVFPPCFDLVQGSNFRTVRRVNSSVTSPCSVWHCFRQIVAESIELWILMGV